MEETDKKKSKPSDDGHKYTFVVGPNDAKNEGPCKEIFYDRRVWVVYSSDSDTLAKLHIDNKTTIIGCENIIRFLRGENNQK